MIWLGIDFETTGFDSHKDLITEVGAVMWDTDLKAPVRMYSVLVYWPGMEVPGHITRLTGITIEMLRKWGEIPYLAAKELNLLINEADYIVAHNAPFDKSFYENCMIAKTDINKIDKPWIDSIADVPYPDTIESKSLGMLAMQHEFLNPFPHRAVTDVLTMFKIISKYDPEIIVKYKDMPTLEIRAVVTFTQKEKAKARNFKWDGDRKIWVKNIKEFQLEQECNEADFQITVTKGETNEKSQRQNDHS